jgi:hypothetical protein
MVNQTCIEREGQIFKTWGDEKHIKKQSEGRIFDRGMIKGKIIRY